MKSINKNIIFIVFCLTITLDLFSCKILNNKFLSFTDDEEIATITSDNENEFHDAIEKLNEKGGTIYIDTPVINLVERKIILIGGQLPGGIIGIRQANGDYPRINFVKKEGIIELFSSFNVYGSNKFIEYIIIENTPNFGISIVGNNNIFDHVISRYNYGSGFAVYGDFNTFNYCYSYRNCDTKISSQKPDGFYIQGEVNNVFNYCFAWDNANSGFNYARILNSSELSYLHSGSWNNGNVDVFTGKYDYDNGSPLDKNLWTIKDIMESDPSFVSNYYNKKYNIDNAKLDGVNVKEWIAKVSPRLDGNGFTFGNRNSSQSIDVKRNSIYCAAFDHKSGGFIDNYNHKYNAYISNSVSFNNGINYKLPFTFSKWTNNWSWSSKNKDQLENVTTKKPRNTNSSQRSFYTVRDQIIKAVSANMFPDGINFDNAINRLSE